MIGGGWVVVEKRRSDRNSTARMRYPGGTAMGATNEFCKGLRGSASTSSLCSDAIRKKRVKTVTSHNCK